MDASMAARLSIRSQSATKGWHTVSGPEIEFCTDHTIRIKELICTSRPLSLPPGAGTQCQGLRLKFAQEAFLGHKVRHKASMCTARPPHSDTWGLAHSVRTWNRNLSRCQRNIQRCVMQLQQQPDFVMQFMLCSLCYTAAAAAAAAAAVAAAWLCYQAWCMFCQVCRGGFKRVCIVKASTIHRIW